MKKQKKLLFGILALIGAGVGAYFIFRKKPSKGGSSYIPPKPSKFQKFRVSTQTSNLNVRSEPSQSSASIASLPKGTIVFARESSASGWYEYSQDGVNVTGYVSKMYLSSDLSGTSGSSSGSGSSSSNYSKYKVATLISNLNVRNSPNGTIITNLPKDSIIWAKPSSTSGWLEYSADGSQTTGYVSETYLVKI
jgi:uncharacterized protein YgiM (DUF1202 family)